MNKIKNRRNNAKNGKVRFPAVIKNKRRKNKQPNKTKNSFANRVGSYIGGSVFGPTGAAVGGFLGDTFNKVFGSGDYKINSNTLLSGQIPVFETNGRETIIAHKEYLADIVGSTAFSLTSYPINPGMSQTFPWLSAVATNYEQYQMLGLIFEYRPSSGTAIASTNTSLGVVMLATDYDAEHPSFTNKQQMLSYQYSCADVPFNKILHPVECSSKDKTLNVQYIRTGALQPNDDLQFYDLGNLQIATQGMQVGVTTVGELWVTYHVRLLKPRMAIPVASTSKYAHFIEFGAGTAVPGLPFGSVGGVRSASSNLDVKCGFNSFIIPDAGIYGIFIKWASATPITAGPVLTPGANFTNYNVIHGSASTAGIYGSTSTFIQSFVIVTTAGTGAANTITVSGLTGMTLGVCDMYITLYPTVEAITF